MRIISFIILLTILYCVLPAEYAAVAKKFFTDCLSMAHQAVKVDKIQDVLSGAIVIEDKKIEGNLTINGSLTAKKAEIGELTVNGDAKLWHSQISKKATINGSLDAHDVIFYADAHVNGAVTANHTTRFSKDLTAEGPVILKDTHAQHIVITQKNKHRNTVKLLGNTSVGSITFQSGKGKAYLADKAVIRGAVIGGTIIKL